MTAADFRRIVLALPGAQEQSHMGHPDFRVGGKIFAGLDGNEDEAGFRLRPEEQEMLMAAEPALFRPAAGAWGVRGWTHMRLAGADESLARSAARMAWRNTAPRRLVAAAGEQGP